MPQIYIIYSMPKMFDDVFIFCRPANLAMKFKTKSACCETAVSCSLSIIAPQLFPNPAEIGVVQALRKLASSPEV